MGEMQKVKLNGKEEVVPKNGQYFFKDTELVKDASGNRKPGDIGILLKNRINEHFKKVGKKVTLKYIAPSYIIRANAANPADRLFCATFAQNAAHAAMTGKTGMFVGYWHGVMTHVPLNALKGKKQNIHRTMSMQAFTPGCR